MSFQKIIIASSVAAACLAIFWLLLGAILDESLPNELVAANDYTFDYVVVGAGTTGSVVASLLAKHLNATILLVEAGEKFGLLSKVPLLTTFQQRGLNDWGFTSVSQRYSSKGLHEQRQHLPRGKGLGGSSQLNFMLHFDGSRNDFHNWATTNNLPDWSWQSMEPYLLAGRAKPHEMYEIASSYSKVTEALRKAVDEDESQRRWSFRPARYNVKNGLRFSVLQRFLKPASQHGNLRIITNAMVRKIHLQSTPEGGKRVQSLLLGCKGGRNGDEDGAMERLITVVIEKELILAAGAYQTPQLLLASGIGDADVLRKLNIPVQHHLPRVGKGLHDHLNMPLFVSIDVIGPTLNQRTLLNPINLLHYLFTGAGPYGNFGVLGHVDVDTGTHPQNTTLTLFGAGAIDEFALMSISNFKRAHFRALFPRHQNASQEGFVLISSCLQPLSRGTVTIVSDNVRQQPAIDPNYLSMDEDIRCTIAAIRSGVQLVTSDAFIALGARIHWPKIAECEQHFDDDDFLANAPSDRYLECIIRHVGLTAHHPGGTCAMGSTMEDSVIDSRMRLHGVANLRITDASVLPTPISGTPNSVLVGMAVRCATMIVSTEQQKSTRN